MSACPWSDAVGCGRAIVASMVMPTAAEDFSFVSSSVFDSLSSLSLVELFAGSFPLFLESDF